MTTTTVLVTGASAGFGLAIAERFLADGARVIAAARRADRLQALADRHPGRVLPLALDVTDRPAAAAALAALPADFAQVDVLVNNAGLALGLAPAHQADLDDWERMIATNCAGLVNVTRAIVPGMVSRGRGSIINIGSIAGEVPYPGGNVYGATKAFVHQFTHNLNADLIGTGVRATCVEPGLVGGTEFSNVRFHGDDQKAASVYAGTQPLTAEDIADTVHWLAMRPAHVTINAISMMPNCQSFGPLQIRRS
ncbi:SDR family NAD(P)-dependent oxidoreductase [Aquincola tertiaricarbonis]|uniref:SDR family NAD(P)-dependent oxidoreductase n=1 Tax=Aquincola tertiaricarbonis TaxID=391953 RepID=UPI000614E7DC|nr:SDR family NAD(P)-dependent oxidoreductase [Aquincola tertiaricarbonis]